MVKALLLNWQRIAALVVFLLTAPLSANEPLEIGSNKQLFLGPWGDDGRDTYLVASMKNVEMTMNSAHVTGERILDIDRPWEENKLNYMDVRLHVTKEGDLFRMWYSAYPRFPSASKPFSRILCYAESDDGIRWRKPNLGLFEWEGSRENNIIIPSDDFGCTFTTAEGAAPFIDPHAKDANEKYKTFFKIRGLKKDGKRLPSGQYALGSPDGIRWKLLSEKNSNHGPADTQFTTFWDDRIGRYVAYTRMKPKKESNAQFAYYKEKYGVDVRVAVKKVGRMVSDNYLDWSREEAVMAPDAMDMAGSPPGLVRLDFYGGNVSKYGEAEHSYIALPNTRSRWYLDLSREWTPGRPMRLPGTMDVQLMTSRDGIQWNRTPRRRPIIGLGPEGSFWSKNIYPASEVIRVGDELWIYFAGSDQSHDEQMVVPTNGAFGRAVLRLDGFISADAAYTGGELTTKVLVFSGNQLQLNVDTSAGGTVQVEIQDAAGKPIDGFTASDVDEINGNYIRKVVMWNDSSDVSSLAGKPVRLRFVMRDTKLYSFEFKSADLQTCFLGDRKLRYLDVGKGKPVMLLHGFACDHTDWRHQIASVAKSYRVIAPDLAFFG